MFACANVERVDAADHVMTWTSWILNGAVFAILSFSAAGAAGQSCVEVCQAKANSCAGECSEKSGESFEACQLGCAKALFVPCVQQCSETGVVIGNDYEIRTPEEPREEE